MWFGYLGSWVAFQDGEWEALWEPHNEHILFVPKIFFFLDLSLFRGSQTFLHICTFLLLFLVTTTFLIILQKLKHRTFSDTLLERLPLTILAATIVAILWSWIQYENFVWAFQIQFLLALLIPLWTFIALYQSARQVTTRGFIGFYLLALSLATLSALTMANGLLIPWLAMGMVLALGLRWVWAVGPLIVGILTGVSYLRSGYQLQKGPEVTTTILQGFARALRYFINYLSGPVELALSSSWAGTISVVAFCILLIVGVFRYYGQRQDALYLVLIFFVLFVVLSGLVTAFARADFGVGQALSSRYQTPLLAGWAALFLLFAQDLQVRIRKLGSGAIVLVVCTLLGFASFQRESLREPLHFVAAKRMATLALALQLPDREAISPVLPVTDFALDYGNRARLLGVTALGREPFVSMQQNLGLPFQGEFGECSVSLLDGPKGIYGDLGSLAASVQTSSSRSLDDEVYWLVDASNRTVGYAISAGYDSPSSTRRLTGYWLPDVELAKVRVGLRGATCN